MTMTILPESTQEPDGIGVCLTFMSASGGPRLGCSVGILAAA